VREENYWTATADMPSFDTRRALPDRADAVIVGGGYTGLSAAIALAQRGARVVVLEQHRFGWGASSRNGGQVLTGTKLSASRLVKRYDENIARALWRASTEAIQHVEDSVREHAIDCGFARTGHLELAAKPSHYAAYEAEAELLDTVFGHPVELIPRDKLASEIDSERYFGGLLDRRSAAIHPARYVAGLAHTAAQLGAGLYDRVTVTDIQPRNSDRLAVVGTSRGVIKCDKVLIATNGYTGSVTPWLHRRVVPVGSYIVATEPLPPDVARALSPHGRMFFDSKHFLFYWRVSADNRLVFGGRAEFVPPGANSVRNSADALKRGIVEVYPQLNDVALAYAWGGTLAFTFDLLPHAGVTPDGLHYALGCGGHGVALLSHLGSLVGRRMAGEAVDNATFELPTPGAPLGLYNGNPWFLPAAALYYRVLDTLE
jgi:glycine/D-amino acid oxidase-like deaminating enzyme